MDRGAWVGLLHGGRKELDVTEWLTLPHFYCLHLLGISCLCFAVSWVANPITSTKPGQGSCPQSLGSSRNIPVTST